MKIFHRVSHDIIFENTSDTLGDTISEALRKGVSLKGANLPNAWLVGLDLSGVNFEGANLTNANLEIANLTIANLEGANLCGANVKLADLTDANLINADLTGADLTEVKFKKTILVGTNFSDAILSRAHLEDTRFMNTNLEKAVFADTYYDKIWFYKSNLESAEFSCKNLQHNDKFSARVYECNLNRTKFSGLTFYYADLSGADLSKSILESIDFLSCNLKRTRFSAEYTKTREETIAALREVEISNASGVKDVIPDDLIKIVADFNKGQEIGIKSLSYCNLSEAILDYALFDANFRALDSDFSKAKLRNCDLRGYHLSGCNFVDADLTGSLFERAKFENCDFKNASFQNTLLDKHTVEEQENLKNITIEFSL